LPLKEETCIRNFIFKCLKPWFRFRANELTRGLILLSWLIWMKTSNNTQQYCDGWLFIEYLPCTEPYSMCFSGGGGGTVTHLK
jgi:hypothetical protein